MNTVKLRLTNNATVDLLVEHADLDDCLSQLGEVMTDPLALYTTEMGAGQIIVPGRNILLVEVVPHDQEDAEE